ncbi:MAG TPA: tetratricopeptide repeat protein [Verrucomicrobiae bacterium]|nr:tetratricopeptide repeat protein [Verrucomicrobiae bacterium]
METDADAVMVRVVSRRLPFALCVFLAAASRSVVIPSAWCENGRAPEGDIFATQGIEVGGASAADLIRPILRRIPETNAECAVLSVCYPFAGSQFPPDIVAPEVLWNDASAARAWLLSIRFGTNRAAIHILCDGKRLEPDIDKECVRDNNRYEESANIASAKGWRPPDPIWERIKRSSVTNALVMTIYGLDAPGFGGGEDARVVSRGSVAFSTSSDPIGAPVFYRDVPLMPSRTKEGVVKPLSDDAVPLVKWRLRDISKPASRVVLHDMPTCANCHSFASDGGRMSMDIDGPDGDKGAHAIMPVAARMSVERDDVFSWNDFRRQNPQGTKSSGLFPRISPDGRYVAATIHDEVYVQNYMDFRFLQTFYPTKGIIAIYDKSSGEIDTLPGADDPQFVQSNPVWSPDGKEVVFIRAAARDSYGRGPRATYANDPNETPIQYDLYRVPFNGGRGGVAKPIPGASANGKSNSFPKISPDGRWIVFVQANNGLLMRPDSKLCIIPASGGEVRVMTCNMYPMNSWHSWSPNGRWLAFSSKAFGPYTRMFLAHVDEDGRDSPAVLVPNCTSANRAVNIPEFANIPEGGIEEIDIPAVDYRRLMKKGTALAKSGKLAEAERYLRESLALRGDYAATHVTYGFVLDSLNRPREAVEQYAEALRMDPRDGGAHRYWAQTLIKARQLDEAVGHLMAALKIDPLDDDAYRHYGDLLAVAGRDAEAVNCYRKALELNGQNAFAHNNLGQILTRSGQLEEALLHFREAVKCDANFASGYANEGAVLAKLGRGGEAVGLYRRAIELDPNHAAAYCNLALLLATHMDGNVRNGEEAVRCATKACELTGYKNVLCLTALAAGYAEVGDFEGARRSAGQAMELVPPGSPQAADIQARVLTPITSGQPIRRGD